MNNQNPFLTIFTPTYNRLHTLDRVYQSLLAQTCQNFEWLIIDDGSTDQTEQGVKQWINDATFPIRYLFQQNSGKHIAWNTALNLAQGRYFECLDSDDELMPDAVEKLRADLEPVPGSAGEIAARAFLLLDSGRNKFGSDLGPDDMEKSFVELVYENKLPSDVWMVFETLKIRQFPFPEIYSKIYFPENYVLYAFDQKFPIRFSHNDRLGVYHRDLNDTISNANSVTIANFQSGSATTLSLMHLAHLSFNMRFFARHPITLFVHAIHYVRFRLHSADRRKSMIREIQSKSGRLLAFTALIPGFLAYLIDSLRIRYFRD